MEAASARYAARDQFAYPAQAAATPLLRYINNACSPENFEPNLALCLEIADLINAKKGNAPREAAVAIVGYINHRNPNVSMLALALLDMCVKNCGYPFHLQISTKEFLNELVRRFPERPPMRTTRVQNRVLELIEEWRRTICETSKYKEDLGFIRDMHRLLTYKGYQFPTVKREDAAVLNPSDNLKSPEEMEAEERAYQSAKLQELIRRGTPHDLQEANKLMKVMAGYDTRHKTDYRAKAAEEVGQVQQKAKLLEEMMQGHRQGDQVNEEGVFEELASALASAHPKIQKMCEEESDDTEAVAKLFEINDSIHRTLERYKLIKKGDVEGANAIPRGTLGVSGAGVRQGPNNELSLIDFGGAEDAAAAEPVQSTRPEASKSAGNALEDDLLGLNMGDGNYGQGGGISLGTADIMAQFSQPTTAPNSIFSHPTRTTGSAGPFGLAASSASEQSSKPQTPIPSASLHQRQQAQQTKASDPFAAFNTPPRQASPAVFQQSVKSATPPLSSNRPPTAGNMDLLGMDSDSGTNGASTAPADDEWTFSSALPDQPHNIIVTNSDIHVIFTVTRTSDNEITIQSRISNNLSEPITDLIFQLAVTKAQTLHLLPQSSRNLAPNQNDGIAQTIRLENVARGQGTNVKLRWRVSYMLDKLKKEQGEINDLGVS
ncbi:Hypothetical protein R9X50_00716000 [Acrodontium crateriforme]|uniref:Uncharacterized protein n=1 Tax=Acrodontium crateriforme TaxID=150365 RepID=A0AAQ3MCM8_9PEZI|nr:Hypothetical protein R9X50_00716000 [Acrodontium crateriforme]